MPDLTSLPPYLFFILVYVVYPRSSTVHPQILSSSSPCCPCFSMCMYLVNLGRTRVDSNHSDRSAYTPMASIYYMLLISLTEIVYFLSSSSLFLPLPPSISSFSLSLLLFLFSYLQKNDFLILSLNLSQCESFRTSYACGNRSINRVEL